MSRKRPERPDSAAPDHSVAVDVLFRQEPDEEEEEEDDPEKDDDDDDDDTTDDGYSERGSLFVSLGEGCSKPLSNIGSRIMASQL
jgi:hypothetical protein